MQLLPSGTSAASAACIRIHNHGLVLLKSQISLKEVSKKCQRSFKGVFKKSLHKKFLGGPKKFLRSVSEIFKKFLGSF